MNSSFCVDIKMRLLKKDRTKYKFITSAYGKIKIE